MRPEVIVSADPAAEAAERIAGALPGTVVLTGGSTPRAAYERLAGMGLDWAGAHVWFTDERCVAPDHEHSNYGMARAALLGDTAADVHRMQGELGPAEGAAAYADELGDTVPDLMLVGLGPDAHICSLFPGDAALGERERRVVGVETPGMAPLVSRITLTLPVVNSAHELLFLVTGEDKADAVRRAFGGGRPDPSAPGSLVEPEGRAVLVADEAAVSRL